MLKVTHRSLGRPFHQPWEAAPLKGKGTSYNDKTMNTHEFLGVCTTQCPPSTGHKATWGKRASSRPSPRLCQAQPLPPSGHCQLSGEMVHGTSPGSTEGKESLHWMRLCLPRPPASGLGPSLQGPAGQGWCAHSESVFTAPFSGQACLSTAQPWVPPWDQVPKSPPRTGLEHRLWCHSDLGYVA